MTVLRQKMIHDIQPDSFADKDQDSYLRAVRQKTSCRKRTARGDVLDDIRRWRRSYSSPENDYIMHFPAGQTSAEQRVLVADDGRCEKSLCAEFDQPV